MKLKTRLSIAFVSLITLPVIFSVLVFCGAGHFQIRSIERTYGITGMNYTSLMNTIQMPNTITKSDYYELEETARTAPEKLEDAGYLHNFNEQLREKGSYLLVREDNEIFYLGGNEQNIDHILEDLPSYEEYNADSENGIYIGEVQSLVKQVDFTGSNGEEGSAFIVTDVRKMLPEVTAFMRNILVAILGILVITGALLVMWIYRGIQSPLAKMQQAAQNIKEGNLDFELTPDADDELGQLCQDFEDMRKRLKDNAEEKLAYDKESKELISNISHDLKTPITAIKGYVEGIMDGVADTPEKMDKYIRTIYNKANEMDLLINELTLYSKIDTNRIPYNFGTMSVNAYFDDCAEDLKLELEEHGVEFGYFNYVGEEVQIIADAEQLKRVVNNIITNSLKYMDKKRARINLRVKDVGDFIQVELEDNGKGIAAKDLPYIFDRFYRTDASRNSSKGGSGIGLSIVKKIVEEHGGKIWATSREGTGTVMYFVIRKYQEVPANE